MSELVRHHYELYPYPHYPLLASIRRYDTYALNLTALWTRFNGQLPPQTAKRILIAGCGSFAPYPFSLANSDADITALDLSSRNIKRAQMHCMLHGNRNVTFRHGDMLDESSTEGTFGLIDAFGVLHHLYDPLAGLKALASRLTTGGILRIMLYSRYARREEESVRRAFRLLGISDLAAAKRIIERSRPGSRLCQFIESSHETTFDSGLADALLHPIVHTYRIEGFMELICQSGLEPLLFAHDGALEDVSREVERIRRMETAKQSPDNFILYLGHKVSGPCTANDASLLMLNPCLSAAVRPLRIGMLHVAAHLGQPNPVLARQERRFLRQFLRPVHGGHLSPETQEIVTLYKKSLFLLQFQK
ncbi:MAG: methyltransferase domain-containing protein [Pedobacter sp.]